MNITPPATLLAAFVAGIFITPCHVLAADGPYDLSTTVIWTKDHRYDDQGVHTYLNVGTGAGEGRLSVQEGVRVEVAGALFIGGKGYGTPYAIEDGHDGHVVVGPGATLECGSQSPSASGGHIYVGWGSGVQGTMLVDGGELISNYILHVGCHVDSDGLMEVLNGGRVTLRLGDHLVGEEAAFLSIATASGSRGLLRVGDGSTLAFDSDPGERTRADIGTAGNGTLIVEGGSRVSLGQDYAMVGAEEGSQGLLLVRDGAVVELPRVTYMATESGSRGDMLIDGSGSRLVGRGISVGEAGEASLRLQEGAEAVFAGPLSVGIRNGRGRVEVTSGALLTSSGNTVVGSRGAMQLADGGRWSSNAPVTVEGDGSVSLRGESRWQAQEAVNFQPGSTLSFVVESPERVPELAVAAGSALSLAPGSRVQLTLSSSLLEVAAQGGFELPLIMGEVLGEDYAYELYDESGLFDSDGLAQLTDGNWGLRLAVDSAAVQNLLADDTARLANGLWSSSGVVQDYTAALFDRPHLRSGRHFWGMGLGTFSRMSAQRGNPGYDFNGGGYAVGADACVNKRTSAGLSFGQVYGSNKSRDGITRIRQNNLMGALYLRHDSHAGESGRRRVLDAYAAYGRAHNRARSSLFLNGGGRSSGRWSDDLYALGVRATWERPLTERVTLTPSVGLRYIHGSHGSFIMAAEDYARGYSSSTLQSLSLPLGVTLRTRYTFGRAQALLPELGIGYVWDISRRNPRLASSMLGEQARSAGAAPGRHAFTLHGGAAWVMNEHWSAGLYYHLECREHELGQAVDLSVGCSF